MSNGDKSNFECSNPMYGAQETSWQEKCIP